MTEIIEKLEQHRHILLKYIFNKKKQRKKDFINNKEILFPKNFNTILYYPNEEHLIKFINKKKSYNDLFQCIYKIIKQEYKTHYNQVYNCVHPAFFIIFYKKFIEYGFEYNITNTNTLKLTHDTIYLRPQYYHCLKIYYYLINDIELKDILGKYKKILYLKLKIEDYIPKRGLYSGRYIDMAYKINEENKVYIEINEPSHNKEVDYLRMREIFSNTLNQIVQYYIEDRLESIKKNLHKEFAKKFYHVDKSIAINLYMIKINNFEYKITTKFTNINMKIKNNNLKLNEFIDDLKKWDFINCIQVIKEMIEHKILNSNHFIDIDNPLNLLNKDLSVIQVKLNSIGVTKILNYPRKEEWHRCNEITNAYSKFMTNYYDMLNDLLSSSNEELKLIHEEYISEINYINIFKTFNKILLEIITKCYKKYSLLKHNDIIPLIIEEKGKQINLWTVKKKINNNKLYNKFIKNTEEQKVIKDMRWITNSELNIIINKYINNINKKEIIEEDSDCEDF